MRAEAKTPLKLSEIGRRLWHGWIKKYSKLILLNFFFIIIYSAANGAYAPVVAHIVDNIESDPSVLRWILVGALALAFVKAGSLLAHRRLNNRIFANVSNDMKRDVYDHMVEADIAWHGREPVAQRTVRITSDVDVVKNGLTRVINNGVRDSLMVVAVIGSMFFIDWQLSLIAMVVFPIAILPVRSISRVVRKLGRQTQEEVGAINAELQESLSSARIAKTFQLERRLKDRSHGKFGRLRNLQVRAADHAALLDPIMEILAGVAVVGILFFVGWRIESGANTIGDFAGFITAFFLAAQPLRAIGNVTINIQNAVAAAQRVFEVLDEAPRVVDAPDATAYGYDRAQIRFDAVSFSYGDGAKALDGVSFEIEAGARVALVGRSGAGKSTVFNLIPRLYDPTEGRVLLNGRDLRDMSLASLRRGVAIVTQEAILFNDTVATNIALGRYGAGREPNREEIVAAARSAGAHDFISEMPEGYETVIGDRGDRLSGGQRQRLSIARAFLRDAPILLLDEATSALDAEAETVVKDALDRLAVGRTTVVIAHRLSTIMDADKIVVLDRGRVVEVGPHAALLAEGGVYASLFKLQFQGVFEEA